MYSELLLQLQKEAEMDGESEDMETGLTGGKRNYSSEVWLAFWWES